MIALTYSKEKVFSASEHLNLFFITVCLVTNGLSIFYYGNKQIEIISLLINFVSFAFIMIRNNILSINLLAMLAVAGISTAFTFVLYGGGGSIINYFIVVFLLCVFPRLSFSKKQIRYLYFLAACILTINLLLFKKIFAYGALNHLETYDGNLLNNNMFGIFSLLALYFSLCWLSETKIKKKLKVFIGVCVFCFFGYYIYISECRSALLYLFLNTKNITWTIFGKNLFSGREYVWSNVADLLKTHFVFGTGGSIPVIERANGDLTTSAHHTLLSSMYCFGIIPTVIFIYVFYRAIKDHKSFIVPRIAQFAILSSLIIIYFESFYFESHISVFALLFFIRVHGGRPQS